MNSGQQDYNRLHQDGLLVSVIIPHYNDLANLNICLQLLSEQSVSRDKYEIVVADNNSLCGLDQIKEICRGRARVVPAVIQGAAEARNAAVRASRGRYLAFVDSDCRPSHDWIERGTAHLSNADMVGGHVNLHFKDGSNLTAVEAFEAVFAFNNKRYVEREDFSVTANMFVPYEIFQKVGSFRSDISEDKDWGQRATYMGFKWVYASDVCVSHSARHTWGELCTKWQRLIRESYMLAKERRLGRFLWALRAWVVLLSTPIHSIAIFFSPALNTFSLRVSATCVLFRIRWWRFIQSYKVLSNE